MLFDKKSKLVHVPCPNQKARVYTLLEFQMPDLLETSAIPCHLPFILLCLISNVIPECKVVLLNMFVINSVTLVLPELIKY